MKIFKKFSKQNHSQKINDQELKAFVDYSIKKYKKTYQLLADYDQGTNPEAQNLARSGPLREAFQRLRSQSSI